MGRGKRLEPGYTQEKLHTIGEKEREIRRDPAPVSGGGFSRKTASVSREGWNRTRIGFASVSKEEPKSEGGRGPRV